MKLTWVNDGRIVMNNGERVADVIVVAKVESVCGMQSRAGVVIPYNGPLLLFPFWRWFMVMRGRCGVL